MTILTFLMLKTVLLSQAFALCNNRKSGHQKLHTIPCWFQSTKDNQGRLIFSFIIAYANVKNELHSGQHNLSYFPFDSHYLAHLLTYTRGTGRWRKNEWVNEWMNEQTHQVYWTNSQYCNSFFKNLVEFHTHIFISELAHVTQTYLLVLYKSVGCA